MLLYLGLAPTLGLSVIGCNQEASFSEVPTDMGRAPMRRLNRDEYDHTIRGVLGIDVSSVELLPRDEEAFDFFTISDALTVSPYHIESYEAVIDQGLAEFFGPFEATYGIEVEGDWTARGGGRRDGVDFWLIGESVVTQIELPFAGTHEIGVLGYAYNQGQPQVGLWVDDDFVATLTFTAPDPSNAQMRTAELDLSAGNHVIRLEQVSGFASLDRIDVTGPLDAERNYAPAFDTIATCRPEDAGDACVDEVLGNFLLRAWRRPHTAEAVAWARDLYQLGFDESNGTFEEGLRLAFKAILMAPEFLYREEVGASDDAELPRALDGYEVANRLSFFLWSSAPDDRLLQAAADGVLDTPGGVIGEARRMLEDPRAEALVDTFTAQWFDIDLLEGFTPDPTVYRSFDENLRASIIEEMRGLSGRFLRGEIDLEELLTSQESWLDQVLADHYRVPWAGSGWQWLSVEPAGRAGLLGTAGWQMAHSHAAGPSVVRRGKWVLGRLLCDSPPPPPPDINQDLEFVDFLGSVRFQEEQQRLVQPCHTCHQVMDPIGHAMGGFSAIGSDRPFDELGYRVDTAVEIDGTPISDLVELTSWVAADERLPRCVVEQTFMFALGRHAGEHDQPHLDDITDHFVNGGATFPALVSALTAHPVFRHRAKITEEGVQ